jgi:ATP-dependent RNA circularization protein (DNA/RNA ligase family)
MNADFLKFPTTPHLLWLGTAPAREDKVLTRAEAESFLRQPTTVEEKVDGANLGISFDQHGNLLTQNRGNLLERGTGGQFAPLWAWLSAREARLFDALEDRFILFGEWCYARHSIHYTMLPDFFLAFDVFDKHEQRFMCSARRDELVGNAELATVPKVGISVFSLDDVPSLIAKSSLYDGPMEGIYFRQECASWLIQRAKVVRREFVQQIGEHWSKQPLVRNRLRPARV